MEKNNKRSSILKRPVAEDSSPTFTKSRRRISFSEKKNVKVFAPGNAGSTIWIKSYEESAEIAPANSTGTLYSGPLTTPESIMRLRSNKIISKLPKKVSDNKAKKSKSVENVPPANTPNEAEEQNCRKFGESMDISLSVSEIQKLLKVEERLPLRPITQYSKQIEEAAGYVSSPQASLICPSPEKIYCSFAVTNNDIRALSKFNNGKKLDVTLADIISEYAKKTLHRNHQSNSCDESMEIVNEGSVSSAHAMGNTSKPKRETMFNLENMELVSVQKTRSKRSTIYYYDSLELSLKNNLEQRFSLSGLKTLDTHNQIQEESLEKDCDKENREVGVDNTNMELSFDLIMHDVNNARNKDINKENRVYIENDNFMDLSDCKSPVQTVNSPQKKLLVHDFTAQKESDLDKMDILLSPEALDYSMQVKPSRNQETIHQSYGFNLIPQITKNENKPVNFIKKNETIQRDDQDNENMYITATHGTENLCNDGKGRALRRQTVNIPCNMDLTLQDESQAMVDEGIEPQNPGLKNDECMNLSIETSQISIEESKVTRPEKIDPRIKRGTLYNHVDLDFTLEENSDESTELKNPDLKNDECMNLSIETSQISIEESKVTRHEEIDPRIKRGTLYNHVDLDFTLEEKSDESTELKNPDLKNDECMNLSIETSQISIEESKVTRHEKIDSRIKRRTLRNYVDLDLTLEEESTECTEPKNADSKNDQCMNLSIETSQISIEESKVSRHEKIDSRIKRGTLHNYLDLDFTLEEESQGRCTKQADSKGREIDTNTNITKEIQQQTSHNEEATQLETTSKSYHVKSADLRMEERNVGQINATDCAIIPRKANQYKEENCRKKGRSVYIPLDMDIEEEADRIYIRQVDLKTDAKGCLKLKEEKISKISNSEQKMNSSITFTQQGRRSDVEFMKWSPITASVSSSDEYLPKNNVISSAKRQTIYDQCDLDISMRDETAIAESEDRVPVDLTTMKETDDYDGIKCNLKNNAENNTISSIKRQNNFSSVNLDLTIQNDLKDKKNCEVNNERIVDTNYTITSVKNNIEHHIEPFNPTEKPSCLPINNKTTPKSNVKDPMILALHKLQSPLNVLNNSCGKNSSNPVQTFDFSMEEGEKGKQQENTKSLKSTEWNMEFNSLKYIDLSECEQLDQTSEVIFCDLSSSSGAIESEIEKIRNAEIVTETSHEIPRLSRASSSHTNTTISTFSANTTQALCNYDLSKIIKKGYKPYLRTSLDFQCEDKCSSNLNLNCTTKDVNLKNDTCENILKSQQNTIESRSTIDRRKSSCSRCKVCDCKPNTEECKRDVSRFSWKFEALSQSSKVDFSGYGKFHNMPGIRDILNAHTRRRESLGFGSYEESVLCPPVPSLNFLLENYEKQYKLQVEKELPIGATFPLIPSLEILLCNKLQSEHLGWKLNTLCMPVGVMEFRHTIIPSVTLIFNYSQNSFDSNDDKLIFEKLELKISKLYERSSPIDKIIENEICLKAPYDLINYCSCFKDLFSFLSFMNNICEKAVQLGKELFSKVVGFNGSLQKDSSDVCFIKKRVLYTPRCNQNGLMSTHDFLIRVRNIENISHTDIMLPPLSDFKESIYSIPKGLEFLTKLFSDPISFLKTD